MKLLKRIDILFLSYLFVTSFFILLDWHKTQSWIILSVRILLILGVFGLLYLSKKHAHPLLILIRKTYPIILSGYFYSETVFYNKFWLNNLDAYLSKLETYMFHIQPSVWFSQYFANKCFSELMYFGYFSFYVLIVSFILFVYFRKKEYFDKSVFQISASLYIFYFIFVLFPTEGPQFYFSSPDKNLPDAYLFGAIMHFIQKIAEQPTGAFPSSHVGISLIILLISKKIAPLFFKIALPFVIILILSTVYIKAHYAVDVLAGIIVAPFVLALSNFFYRFLAKNGISV
jgi:membrane-associated phospholipid phosphatase